MGVLLLAASGIGGLVAGRLAISTAERIVQESGQGQVEGRSASGFSPDVLVYVATALLFALTAHRFLMTPFSASSLGDVLTGVVYTAFLWVLVVLVIVDLRCKRLPSRIIYPALLAGWAGLVVASLLAGQTERLLGAVGGALIFGGLLFVVAFISPGGMGGGDVRLALLLGTFVGFAAGPGVVVVAIFISFLLGGLAGVVTLLLGRGSRKARIPFGPFLAAGGAIAIFLGQPLLDWYLSTTGL